MDLFKQKMSPFETLRAYRVLSASGGLPNLLRYETFAVADYGSISHALHLPQTRQSLNLGLILMSSTEWKGFVLKSSSGTELWLDLIIGSYPGLAYPQY